MVSEEAGKLGEIIQKKRGGLKMTQEALAQKTKIPCTSISKIEQGKIENPAFSRVVKIAKALDIPLYELAQII